MNIPGTLSGGNWLHRSRGVNFPDRFSGKTALVFGSRDVDVPVIFSGEIFIDVQHVMRSLHVNLLATFSEETEVVYVT